MKESNTAKNLISYRASAGSGKTYTLAIEYISLCLRTSDPSYYKRIMAITFTNKAAAELKERILEFTKHLSTASNDDDKLLAIRERVPVDLDVLRTRSKSVFSHMLYNYADIHVSTIDHFVLSILKAFSKELGLSFDFKVELDQGRITEILVDELLGQIGLDDFITETLVAYSISKLEEGKGWHPRRDLAGATQELFKESSAEALKALGSLDDEVLKTGIENLKINISELKKQMLRHQKKGVLILETNGLDLSDFKGKSKSPAGIFYRDLEANAFKLTDGQRDKLDTIEANPKGLNRSTVEMLIPELIGIGKAIVGSFEHMNLILQVYKERLSLLLANRLSKLLKQLEKDEDISLISGNNQRIADVVRGNPAPFIYERIGERFRHFLIDEFQDTSLNQWHNFLPLIDNSLSQGHKNLLVGDAKQSIYRWRNSEVEQILALPDIFNKGDDPELNRMAHLMTRSHDSRSLRVNYRSARTIIAFNNELFQKLNSLLASDLALAYDDVSQVSQRSNTGYVELEFLENKANLEEHLHKTLSRIKECLNDGYALSDIGLLTRKNKEGQVLASFLKENDIPISSSDSLLLYGNDTVHLLLNLLQFVHGKKQAKADLFVLHHILERYGESHRFHDLASAYHRQGSSVILKLLKEQGILINLRDYQSESIYDSAERLCRDLWVDANDPFVQDLMNRLMSHSRNVDSSLDGFLEEFDRSKSKWSISSTPDEDAVQLMTIHRSKGLQFPVVILPFWKSRTGGRSSKAWFPWDQKPFGSVMLPMSSALKNTPFQKAVEREKELQTMDELNLLYVACTRPEERLYMSMVELGPISELMKQHLEPKLDQGMYSDGVKEPRAEGTKKVISTSHNSEPIPTGDPKVLLRTAVSSESPYSTEREFGKMVHAILEKNERIEDIPDFIDKFSSGKSLNTDQRIALEQSVKAALQIENSLKLEEKGFVCLKEQEILSPGGNRNRLDRLYLKPSSMSAVVLDFKTGKPDSKDERQMKRYHELLSAMGYEEIKAYLLYTQNANLVEVQL